MVWQLEIVLFLLKAGADVHAKDCFQNTSLSDAVRYG